VRGVSKKLLFIHTAKGEGKYPGGCARDREEGGSDAGLARFSIKDFMVKSCVCMIVEDGEGNSDGPSCASSPVPPRKEVSSPRVSKDSRNLKDNTKKEKDKKKKLQGKK